MDVILDPAVDFFVCQSVPFQWVADREFQFKGFTHVVVAQFLRYTPESSDQLFPVFREYFRPG